MKWIYFDVDDTLYDQKEVFCQAFRYMHFDQKPVSADEIFTQSMGYTERLLDMIQNGTIPPEEMISYRTFHAMNDYGVPISKEEAGGFRDRYVDLQKNIMLTPVMEELMEECKGKIGLGIITNGAHHHQGRKIQAMNLERWIPKEYIIISGDVDCVKPDREIFQEAEHRSKAVPKDMIYVGDNFERDVIGASQAGWTTIWMNRAEKPRPDQDIFPDFEAHTEEDLLKIIRTEIL